MSYSSSPSIQTDIPFDTNVASDTNQPYGNVPEDDLDEARRCYATAFLFLDTSLNASAEYYQPVINLLDRALQLVPDFLDAYYLREETWHNFLRQSKGTVNHDDVYNSYLCSKAWEDKRTQVLKRDGYRCVCCNTQAVDIPLDVHHKTYENIGKEPLSDLAAMCKSCHDATHERLQAQEDYRQRALNRPSSETTSDTKQKPHTQDPYIPDNVV